MSEGIVYVYIPSPIKRRRRRKDEVGAIRQALVALVEQHNPMTVRQVFYQAVSAGLIDKTETEYKATICRLLTELRRSGDIPWGWITDYTRAMRKPQTFDRLEAAVEATARYYRRALWSDLDIHVEVWLEKDALAGVLYKETAPYDVPLMVTRGYPSLSFLHGAGQDIEEIGKPTFIYYFGDRDPSGADIPRNVEKGLREFAPSADIYFEQIAVLPKQIEAYGLPTRPTKKTDSRAYAFKGESVEVDAIPPDILRALCREAIERHLTDDILNTHRVAEASERELLARWAAAITDARPTAE